MSAHDDFSLHDDEELSLHDDASLMTHNQHPTKEMLPAKPPQIITTIHFQTSKTARSFQKRVVYDTWRVVVMEHYLELLDNEVVLLLNHTGRQFADEIRKESEILLLMAASKRSSQMFYGMGSMPKRSWKLS
ncbi:hypothetical protein Tco_0991136 [Tanacetum coccineum]|uniref:Uncharacterized protein n=1 Tax=Tanacetum coccineum TaxID=301880 RepID=A0ABQ5F044_9ASTR